MRGIAAYLLIGFLAIFAIGAIAPAAWLGLPVHAWPMVRHGAALQHVDRAHKSDRLVVPISVMSKTPAVKRGTPDKPVKILDGCDPVFSPLSASAQANLPGRCAA